MSTDLQSTSLVSTEYYGDDFYQAQMDESYRSAKHYVEALLGVHAPRRVVDVGCGRGTWLKAFKERGAEKIVGFDGPWNQQANMLDPSTEFHSIDLNRPANVSSEDRFDLALSLEVAEHLEAASARGFVEFMTALSDVVMFGAAYSGQGGTNHINEQMHTYWARMFLARDYVPYDFFRPRFWGHAEVKFWYQQNTFLYVHRASPFRQVLAGAGCPEVTNIEFMNCVHPDLYDAKRTAPKPPDRMTQWAKRMLPPSLHPFAKKIKNALT